MDMQSALTGKHEVGERATDLLREDHRKIRELAEQYLTAMDQQSPARRGLAEEICMQLELQGQAITLTEKECNFLHLLTINTRPVPRQVIVAGIGGDDPDAGRRVDMLVYRLRKKARSGLGQDLPLRSAYGEGYSLSASFNLS